MLRMMIALVLSLGITLAIGPTVIKYLRALKAGKKIYELGPKHQAKEGTPMMGGIMMVIAMIVTVLVCHPRETWGPWDMLLAVLLVALGFMAIGLADDLIQVVKKRHEGLTPMQKIAGQVIVAVAFSTYCYFNPMVGSSILIPFLNTTFDLGIFYIPVMSLFAIFMVNSSNLQDGLDGLEATATRTGCVGWMAVALFLMVMARTAGGSVLSLNYWGVAIYAIALVGATTGYLRFNRYPAQVFMGDMGSMFIGGSVVGMAYLMREPLMLLFICFTMVMSSVSVMMQTTYFKLTHGKRIFKMSPIHHHFELCGMKETQIVAMYASITGVLSLLVVMGLLRLVI